MRRLGAGSVTGKTRDGAFGGLSGNVTILIARLRVAVIPVQTGARRDGIACGDSRRQHRVIWPVRVARRATPSAEPGLLAAGNQDEQDHVVARATHSSPPYSPCYRIRYRAVGPSGAEPDAIAAHSPFRLRNRECCRFSDSQAKAKARFPSSDPSRYSACQKVAATTNPIRPLTPRITGRRSDTRRTAHPASRDERG